MKPESSKIFNIAFVARSTLFSSPGGDTVQIEMTAKYLRKLGNSVRVFTTNETIPYHEFDLLHYFNLTRPADILNHIDRSGIPFFLSPIHLDLQEYERKNRTGIQGFIARNFSSSRIEYLKCIARYVRNGEKINSWTYILKGHNASMKYILKKCASILPNSQSELNRIEKAFHYSGAAHIIPCGVDLDIFHHSDNERQENLVLCVGRVEGRKNQLHLIKALNNTDYELVIIGNPSPNHKGYYEECKRIAGSNVRFIENIEHAHLIQYYQKAKVHVLPSWFETVGLSSLEAASCGAHIVVCDKGDVMDYFNGNAWYCSPDDEKSIFHAVNLAASAPLSSIMREKIVSEYNWEIAASKTLDAYKSLLPNPEIAG